MKKRKAKELLISCGSLYFLAVSSMAVAQNQIDDPTLFVAQHYFDFLNRDPANTPSEYEPHHISTLAGAVGGTDGIAQFYRSFDVTAGRRPAASPPDADYQQMRAAYIARLRGMDAGKPFDPQARSAAIKQMEKQESIVRKGGVTESSALGSEAPIGGAWTFIGPAFLPNGQTTSISTAVSGRVTAIDVDPGNPDIAYVGAAQGGVFRTTDGGATWTPLMDSAQSLAIGAIAVAPSDPSKVYIGTGEGNNARDSFFGVGIYRIDGANTASPTLVGPFNKTASNADIFTGISITKIVVSPTNADMIFASTTLGFAGINGITLPSRPSRGLYRSTNAAQANPTFTKLSVTNANNGDRPVTDMVFEPGNPNNLVLAVGGLAGSDTAPDGGVYVSTNAQAATPTFTRVLITGTATGSVRTNLAINKVNDMTTVLVATNELRDGSTTAFKNGALKTSTNIFSSPPTFRNLPAADGFCGGNCIDDIAVTIDPNNASIIYLGGPNNSGSAAASGRASLFQRSIDGGATFARIDVGLHSGSHAFVLTPTNPARGYFGSNGGVWRSDNVNTATASSVAWTSLNNSTFSATQFNSIALHPSDPNFTIGGTEHNGTEFRDPSGAWVRVDGGDGGNAVIDQNAKDTTNVTIYHTYFNQIGNLLGFARADSITGGFTNVFGCGGTPNGINCSDSAVLFYAPLVRGPGLPNTIYYGTDRLYRSADKGVTATVVSQAPLVSGVPLSAIGISPQNDGVRVVGLANGKVFATTTDSATLNDVSAGLPATYVSRAVIDPNNQNIAYLTFADFNIAGGTVWRTTNLSSSNVTWASLSGTGANTLPNVPVNAFVVNPQNSNQLYAGTDIGVYFSQDSGGNWFPFGTGLPRVAVFDMAITSNRLLRIATHGRGMWETAAVNTSPGSNVTVQTSNAAVTFSNVSQSGNTTFTLIDPASAGAPPSGYTIVADAPAYDLTTTATYTPPIDVCFTVNGVNDATVFSKLRLLHSENGVLVDRTFRQDFGARQICARVSSLSPFVLAMTDTPFTNPTTQLLNISTRGNVGTGDNALIGGFFITGSESKKVIIRAIGPTLTAFGVPNALQDPTLALNDSSNTEIAANDDWGTPDDPAITASGYAPKDARESAIVRTLAPGGYTAVVRGKDAETHIALVEVIDLQSTAKSILGNISTRGFVDVGDAVMIGGFIVGGSGTANARVVVRAIGPTLTPFGISNALQDPTLELVNANGTPAQTNDNWQDTQAAEIQSTNLAPKDPNESAILASLPAGNYTAIVRGKDRSMGTALVEIYNVP